MSCEHTSISKFLQMTYTNEALFYAVPQTAQVFFVGQAVFLEAPSGRAVENSAAQRKKIDCFGMPDNGSNRAWIQIIQSAQKLKNFPSGFSKYCT